jgi:nucleotide-binding universal stress UspA family protein
VRAVDTIVVWFDGSEFAQSALLFAIEEAKSRGARLRVVTAWELKTEAMGEGAPALEIHEQLREEAEGRAAQAAAIVQTEAPELEVQAVAIEGSPGNTLIDNAAGAKMIVIGTRGRGAVTGALLGSVTHDLIGRTPIPVVVVPRPARSG